MERLLTESSICFTFQIFHEEIETLSKDDVWACLEARLPQVECSRIQKYIRITDKIRSGIGYFMMLDTASRCCNEVDIKITRGTKGKPTLSCGSDKGQTMPGISLSHQGPYIISSCVEIMHKNAAGDCVSRIPALVGSDLMDMASLAFLESPTGVHSLASILHPDEIRYVLSAATPALRQRTAALCICVKEAFVKATGEGISSVLKDVNVFSIVAACGDVAVTVECERIPRGTLVYCAAAPEGSSVSRMYHFLADAWFLVITVAEDHVHATAIGLLSAGEEAPVLPSDMCAMGASRIHMDNTATHELERFYGTVTELSYRCRLNDIGPAIAVS